MEKRIIYRFLWLTWKNCPVAAWQIRGPPPSPRHVSLLASPPAQINDPCSWKYWPNFVLRKRVWQSSRLTMGSSTFRSSAWYFPSGPRSIIPRMLKRKNNKKSAKITLKIYQINWHPILFRSTCFQWKRPYPAQEDKSAWYLRYRRLVFPEQEQLRREIIHRCNKTDAQLSHEYLLLE